MTKRHQYSARLPLTVGFLALTLLVGGLGFWSINTRISGAVIASGLIVVESNRQVVQHAEGGIVGEIAARDGDFVATGDLLVRLDDTLLQSELSVIDTQLIELGARRARLEAERDDRREIKFPDALVQTSKRGKGAAEQIEGQRTLFFARFTTLEKELGQIDERIEQTGNQILGTKAQLNALDFQERLLKEELIGQEILLAKGLVQFQKVSALRRESAGVAGDIGRLTSDIAQHRGQIASLEIQKLKLQSTRREQAITTLRDLQFRELELSETRSGLLERMSRMEVRAPVSGIVYSSSIFALNSVIQAADPLMYVVPQDQPLVVAAKVEAIHIDQVHVGQAAILRFTAFNQRLTPEIVGVVIGVSADAFQDEVSGLNYYRVELKPLETEMAELDNQDLLPGMPVEAYLKTEERTPLSYLMKPMTDYFKRALREG